MPQLKCANNKMDGILRWEVDKGAKPQILTTYDTNSMKKKYYKNKKNNKS